MEPKKPKEPLTTEEVKDFLKKAEAEIKKGKKLDLSGLIKRLKP